MGQDKLRVQQQMTRHTVTALALTLAGALLGACNTGSHDPSEAATATLPTKDLKVGDVREVDVGGNPVVLVVGSTEEIQRLRQLDGSVFEKGPAVENPPTKLSDGARVVFAVIAISPYAQCKVTYVPHGPNAMQWSEKSWLGGFHSPCHSEVFDLLGRQIGPGPYSPTSFPKLVGNLSRPELRLMPDDGLVITVR